MDSNAVHLSGAAFDLPENGSLISSPPWVSMAWGVFYEHDAYGPNPPTSRGVWAGDNAPAITAIWFAMN